MTPADTFRLLGDRVRLRILRLLARERLNVGELTESLDLAQSTVSRHVRLLREGELVAESREDGYTWLALAETAPAGLDATWTTLCRGFADADDAEGDDARLADVLRRRDEREVGWGRARPRPQPGRSWSAWARALGHLVPPWDVVDLGCGEGALTREVARWARRVVGVEPAGPGPGAVRGDEAAGDGAPIEWIEAPLEATGLEAASFDLALLSQTLHRVVAPADAVREAVRLLRPGGRLLVLDLLRHEESWVKDRLGHRHPGFEPEALRGWLEDAGLEALRLEEAARRRGNPFTVLVASGSKRGERNA